MNDLRVDDDTVGVALLVSNDYESQENIKHLSFTHKDVNEKEISMETLFRDDWVQLCCLQKAKCYWGRIFVIL